MMTINEIMTLQRAVFFCGKNSFKYIYYIIQQPHCALARQLFFENLQQQTRCLSFCLLCYCVPQSRKVNDSDPEIACLFGGLLASCCLLDRAVACAAGLHANLHSSGIFLTIPFTHQYYLTIGSSNIRDGSSQINSVVVNITDIYLVYQVVSLCIVISGL